MDYRALAELVVTTLMGLSVFSLALGFSVKVFLGPIIRDVARELGRPRAGAEPTAPGRLTGIEERLDALEQGLERVADAQRFDRVLGRPDAT